MSKNTDLYSLYGNEYRGSYFKGLKGLSFEARQAFEEENKDYLEGLSDEDKDEQFRVLTLRHVLKSHKNPAVSALWTNADIRNTELDTPEKRNKIWSQLALTEDLDSHSEDADSSAGIGDWLKQMLVPSAKEREYDMAFRGTKKQQEASEEISSSLEDNLVKKKLELDESTTARNQAREYLTAKSEEIKYEALNLVNSMPEERRTLTRNQILNLSEAMSPNFYGRFGTSDTDLNDSFLDALTVDYLSWERAGGEIFANEQLANFWQNYYAKKQTQGEKWVNASAKFGQEVASTAIIAAGVAHGLMGTPWEDTESYWKGIIDNELTRYGVDLFTTGQWDKSKQEEYKAKGWHKYDILSTVDQQRALLSANTPAELFAQYGFTAASMLLSGGLSGAIKGGSKLAVGASLKAGLKSTETGRKIIKGIIGAERIAQMTVPISVAIPEATLEALTTRDESMRAGLENIKKIIASQVDLDILNAINEDPAEAESFIKSKPEEYENYRFAFGTFQTNRETGTSSKVYSDLDKQRMYELLRTDPDFIARYQDKYKEYEASMLKQLESSENTTLWTTLGLNMAILGTINSTAQITQQALGVRRALGKAGSNRFANAVDLIQTNRGTWKALAKNVTKSAILKDRVKESLGEGTEEVLQAAASALSEGMANDKVQQYFEARYNSKGPLDAFTEDTWQMLLAGLYNGGERLVSRDTFKEGLYGTLSTLLGGPSVNFNMDVGKRRENESYYDMIMRNSPISMRGIYEVAFSSAEQKARQEENQRIADSINNFLSTEENQQIVFDIVSSLEATRAFNDAAVRQDEREARDSKIDVLFSTASMLSSMRGTGFYDVMLKTLEERTKFNSQNLDDEASNESIAVEEYRLKTGSKYDREYILEEIKFSAQTLLDIIRSAETEAARVRRIFGDNISLDVQNAMVSNRLHIADTEKRIKQIQEEFSRIDFSETDGVTPSNAFSPSVKRGFARWGNVEEAQNRQQELKKEERALSEAIIELNKPDTSLSEEDKNNVKRYRNTLINSRKAVEDEIELLENYLTEIQKLDDQEITLSMQDIANLDTESQYALLHPEKRELSERQLNEIEKFISRGTKLDSGFKEKLEDLRQLKKSLRIYTENDFYLLTNPEVLLKMAAAYRRKTVAELNSKKYDYLADQSSEANLNYGSFMRALLDARTKANSKEELEAINNAAKESQFWQRFLEYEKEFDTFIDKVVRTEWYADLSGQRKQDADNFLISLFRDGAPFNSIQRVYNSISKIDLSIPDLVTKAYREKFESYSLPVSDGFDGVQTIMDLFNILKEMQKTEDEINSRPTVAPADASTGKPATPVNSQTEGSTVISPKTTIINSIIESLRKMYADNSDVQTALAEVESIAANFSSDSLESDINDAIKTTNNPAVKDTLIYIRNVIRSGNPQPKESNSVVTNNPNPQAGQIESFSTTDLASMKDNFGGEKMKSILTDIFNFLSSPEGYAAIREYHDQKKALKFYVPSDLEEETRQSLGAQYLPEIDSPVIILMPYKNGTITINGKKYQPIGILPSVTNQRKSGAANTEIIRKSLMNEDGSIKVDTISSVQSNSWQVPGKAPEHLDASQPNTNVRDLVKQEDQMSLDEFAEAMAIERPIQVLGIEEGQKKSRPRIIVNIPNYKKSGSTTAIDVFITKAVDVRDSEGKNLFDYLIEGNQDKALNFNWRIQQVADILRQVLGNETLETDNVEILNEVSDTINKYINRYIRFSGAFRLKLNSERQEDGSTKISLSLGISDSVQATILDDITRITDEEKNQKVFETLQNILLNKEHTAPKERSTTGQFMIYQVDYKSMEETEGEINTNTTNNIFASAGRTQRNKARRLHRIKQDIEAGLFSVSKSSLEYRAEGIRFSLSVERAEEYGSSSTLITPSNYTPSTTVEAPSQPAETSEGALVETTTGEVVRQEKKEEELSITDTQSEKASTEKTASPKKRQRGSGEYSGNYDSIGSTTIRRSSDRSIVQASKLRERLKKDGITKEKWDSMTPAEKQRIIDCC